VTGGGDILLDPDGQNELQYSWVLGFETNNLVEDLALWQGIQQALRLNIQ